MRRSLVSVTKGSSMVKMLLTSAVILVLLCCDAEGGGSLESTGGSLYNQDYGQRGFNIGNSVASNEKSRIRRNLYGSLYSDDSDYEGSGAPTGIDLDKFYDWYADAENDTDDSDIEGSGAATGIDTPPEADQNCWDVLGAVNTSDTDELARNVIRVLKECELQPSDILMAVNATILLGNMYSSDIGKLSPEAARTISEVYLENMVKVFGELLNVPEEWRKLDKNLTAITLTTLLQSISKASIKFIDLVTTCTKKIPNKNLEVLAHSQFKEFFDGNERQYNSSFYSNTSIFLPEEFCDGYLSEDGTVKVVFSSYRTLHTLGNVIPLDPANVTEMDLPAKQQLNSGIIGALVGEDGTWHSDKGKEVEVKLGHVYTGMDFHLSNISCVWWDEDGYTWSTDGCYLHETNAYYSICRCNHLTNFAILMDIDGILSDTEDPQSLRAMTTKWITLVGSSLSCLCLCLSLGCILATKSLREATCWKVRSHLCVSLLFTQLLLLVGPHVLGSNWLCLGTAVLLHYVVVCAFTWGSVESLNMYLMFAKVFRTSPRMPLYFFAIGYGLPALVIGITLGITRGDGYYTDQACWLAPGAMRWSFVGVLGFLFLTNLVAFLLLIRLLVLMKHRRPSHSNEGPRLTDRILGTATISLVLGLTWVTGFLFVFFGTEVMATIFAFNSFQGVWIFLCGIVFDRRIRGEILKNVCHKPRREFKSSETTKQLKSETRKDEML